MEGYKPQDFSFFHRSEKLVQRIAESDSVEDMPYTYSKSFKNLNEFDALVKTLSNEEAKMRLTGDKYRYYEFDDPFFRDWYNVIYKANMSKDVEFVNPILNDLRFKIY